MAKDSGGHGSDKQGFGLTSHTHEIVAPNGHVAARMRLGKMNGLRIDTGGKGGLVGSGGPSIHDAVAMAEYSRTRGAPGTSFPAEHIAGPLHFLTGKDFAGHMVRRVK